jgi:hypothetical protein
MAVTKWTINQHITRGGVDNLDAFKRTTQRMHEKIVLRLKWEGIVPKVRECELDHQ